MGVPDFGAAAKCQRQNRPQLGSQSICLKEGLKERCAAFLDVLVSIEMSIKKDLYGAEETRGKLRCVRPGSTKQ
jgi:hypothetical protein